MKGFSKFYIVIAFLTCNLHFAQQSAQQEELSLDSGSIESQFEYLYKKSGNYNAEGKRYEVVRIINLDKLKKNVLDSVNASNKKAIELTPGHFPTYRSLAVVYEKLGKQQEALDLINSFNTRYQQ